MSKPPPDGTVKDEIEYPFVPPGRYNAVYKDHSIFRMYGKSQKMRVFFTITDDDERNAFGQSIPWFKNVNITSSKNHSWNAGRRSAFMETFCTLFHEYNPNKQKRIPMSLFQGKQFRIDVVTVEKNRFRKKKPEHLHYSKVAEIHRV